MTTTTAAAETAKKIFIEEFIKTAPIGAEEDGCMFETEEEARDAAESAIVSGNAQKELENIEEELIEYGHRIS